MLVVISIISISILLLGFLYSNWRSGISRSIISHFWFFTLAWCLAFPIRALLISYGLIDLQVVREWQDDELIFAIMLSLLYWGVVYAGYLSVRKKQVNHDALGKVDFPGAQRGFIVIIITMLLGMYFLYNTTFSGEIFEGNQQNEARVGSGGFFLLAELFLLAAIAYLGRVMCLHRKWILNSREWALYTGIFLMLVMMMVALNSRRFLALLLLSFVVVYSVKHTRRWIIPVVAIVGSIFLLPVLQILRYINISSVLDGSLDFGDLLSALGGERFMLTSISSSYEGIDHVANFLEKVGWLGAFAGVDGGIAWFYNAFLALIPRNLWSDKPMIYGSVAQQFLLYPDMYAAGAATTTLPVSFVVDFTYGFGILFWPAHRAHHAR